MSNEKIIETQCKTRNLSPWYTQELLRDLRSMEQRLAELGLRTMVLEKYEEDKFI